ncbi:ArnT family glycosyltransferase [Pseudomonadota bacterium]
MLGGCFALAFPLFYFRGIGVFDDSLFLRFGELVVDGFLPYRDLFDNKPPGIFYLSAIIAVISDGHWSTPRTFLFLWGIIFGLGVTRFVQNRWGSLAALSSALVFGLSYPIAQGYSLHTEQFCATFSFAALAVVSTNQKNSLKRWLASGFLVGIAFQFKQPAAIFVLPFVVGALIDSRYRRKPLTEFLSKTFVYLLGFLSVQCFVLIGVVYLGIFKQYFEATVTNALYMSGLPFNALIAIKLWFRVPAIALAFLAVILVLLSKRLRIDVYYGDYKKAVVISTLAGVVALLPTLRIGFEHGHYAGMSIPFLCVLVGVVVSKMVGIQKWTTAKMMVSRKSIVFALLVLTLPYAIGIVWGGSKFVYEETLNADLKEWKEIKVFIAANSEKESKLLCLSSSRAPQCYYMVKKWPTTRYLFYWVNTEGLFSIADATKMLLNRETGVAAVEVSHENGVCESLKITANDCLELFKTYSVHTPRNPDYSRFGTKFAVLIRRM